MARVHLPRRPCRRSSAGSTGVLTCSRRWPSAPGDRRRRCRVGSSRCSRWRWCCSTTPRCCIIDELSLGLAPLRRARVARRDRAAQGRRDDDHHRRAVAERRARVADRAVFLEKGQVRFSGPAARARRTRRPRARRVPRERRRLSRRGRRDLDHVQLVFDGVVAGLVDRPARDGHRADLPVDARHQLRGRQHGTRRRQPARAARGRVRRPVLARGDRMR